MDAQLKRGLIEVCVLKALSKGDSYGYMIIKDMKPHTEVSESTLYPILKRLESAEMLTVYSVEHNGRIRKYYRITDKGKEKIDTFLNEWNEIQAIYDYIKGADEND